MYARPRRRSQCLFADAVHDANAGADGLPRRLSVFVIYAPGRGGGGLVCGARARVGVFGVLAAFARGRRRLGALVSRHRVIIFQVLVLGAVLSNANDAYHERGVFFALVALMAWSSMPIFVYLGTERARRVLANWRLALPWEAAMTLWLVGVWTSLSNAQWLAASAAIFVTLASLATWIDRRGARASS
jgi:hypothetical protein